VVLGRVTSYPIECEDVGRPTANPARTFPAGLTKMNAVMMAPDGEGCGYFAETESYRNRLFLGSQSRLPHELSAVAAASSSGEGHGYFE
jgi:hypothetical protein